MAALPPIHRWDQVVQARAAVHIVHGLVEHGQRYARLAAALNAAHFNVWAHDHRGHGINPEPGLTGNFADRDGWRTVVDDTWAVSSAMRAAFPALPLVLFAHSMGSFVGQTLMGEHGADYHAVVLSGSNGAPGFQEGVARGLARAQALIGPREPGRAVSSLVLGTYNRQFAPTRTPHDWLSRDTHEVDKYAADPMCQFQLTGQAWIDFLDGKRHLGTPGQVSLIRKDLPVYLWSGARDAVGESSKGVTRLFEAYRAADMMRVAMQLYPEARHEMVNETNRDAATADLVAWIDSALQP